MTDDIVTIAERIARRAHTGQVDKAGADYIDHPRRVAAAVISHGPEAVAPAWLHDVLEDTDEETPGSLIEAGIPSGVVTSVLHLTRHGGETYTNFIKRIVWSRDPVAIAVKLADLRDNLRPGCTEDLRTRYQLAIDELERGARD